MFINNPLKIAAGFSPWIKRKKNVGLQPKGKFIILG